MSGVSKRTFTTHYGKNCRHCDGEWFQVEKRIRVLSDSKAVGFAVCTVCAESTHLRRDRRKTPAPTPTSIAVPDQVKKNVAYVAVLMERELWGDVFAAIYSHKWAFVVLHANTLLTHCCQEYGRARKGSRDQALEAVLNFARSFACF